MMNNLRVYLIAGLMLSALARPGRRPQLRIE